MQQPVILSLMRTLPSRFIYDKFLMQFFLFWQLMQTHETRPYEHVIPVLHTLYYVVIQVRLACGNLAENFHRVYYCRPTNTLTCVIFPVRCHDPLQPLPDSVWAFDKTANITKALLCCGPEHPEEHQDGDDYTRCYALREIHYRQWSPVRGCEINIPDRTNLFPAQALYTRGESLQSSTWRMSITLCRKSG